VDDVVPFLPGRCRAYVFTDASLAPFADRFVWLAADTEKAQNAALTVRYPVDAYPSFFVIDPNDDSVAARKIGSMTVPRAAGVPARRRAPWSRIQAAIRAIRGP